jgi:hypothetical protein
MLKRGRSTITNGTWLELSVNEADPGDTLACHRPRTIPIKARAIGRNDFGRVELIRNGEVVAGAGAVATGDHFAVSFEMEHELKEPEWWALRIAHPNSGRNELNQPLFAHTSPVYIEYQKQRVFDRPTAQSLIDEMELSTKQIRRHGKFANDGELQGVLGIYRQAIAALTARM